MNIDAYLRRIGLSQRPPATLDGLRAVHRAHLIAIPYENLDVQLRQPVTIERPAIYEKIVERGRGGWCYEMNGLLGWALGELGFRVTRATGAVMREAAGDVVVGNHLVLKVELDEGVYLTDVGFGDGPLEPIRIAPGDFSAHGFAYGLTQIDDTWWRLRNHPRGGARSFDFSLTPADEALFAARCEFLQTSDVSPFVQNLVCQRYTPDGLTILRGKVLRKLHGDDEPRDRILESADAFMDFLNRDFALDVPEARSLWPAIEARHAALFATP